jgi:cytosine/adenosine deaminase-related metal-dependent hydrolase
VLGRDDIGQISPGKAADLAIFRVDTVDFAGSLSDPVAALLFCGVSHRAQWTIVNGHVVVENGHLVHHDEARIAARANEIARDLLDKKAAAAA